MSQVCSSHKIYGVTIFAVENGYGVFERNPNFQESLSGKKWVFESMEALHAWMKENMPVFPKSDQGPD